MMKKFISAAIAAAAIITVSAGSILSSKADMKIETADFSVTADRTQMPSAFCLNADGSPVSEDYSNCGKFCIDCCWHGNATIMSIDGDYAYCIGKHWQKAPTSLTQADKCTDITPDEQEYAPIFSIAMAGASSGTTENGLCETDLYYVTQCAIRSMMYGIPADALAFFNNDGSLNEPMTNEFRRLREAENDTLPSNEAEMFIDDSLYEETSVYIGGDCYFRYGPYYPYILNDIQPSFYTIDFEAHDDDIFVCGISEPYTTENTAEFQEGSPIYIFINALYQNETTFSVNADIETAAYYPVVYLSHDSSSQSIAQLKITDTLISTSADLILKNTDTVGDIIINKKFISDGIDISDKTLIAEPRFAIKNSFGKYVNGINANGTIIFDSFTDTPVEYALNSDSTLNISNLPVGEYYICEIKGAEGFEAENEELIIENTPYKDECDFINYIVTTTAVTTVTEATTTTQQTTSEVTTTPVTTAPTETTTPETTTTPEMTTVTTMETTETTTSETTASSTTSEAVTTSLSVTTPSETTTSEMTSITITITDTTYMTNFTTDYETQTETVSETTEETTVSSEKTTTSPTKSSKKITTYRRTTGSPKTGYSPFPFIILAVSMVTASIAAFLSRK